MPLGPADFFWVGVVPCAVAALVMWLCARAGVRATAAWAMSVGGTVFVCMAAQHLRVGSQTALDKLFHPRVGVDWLPWLVLVAAFITTLAAYAPRQWQRWLVVLAGIFALATPLRLLAANAAAMGRWSVAEKLGVLSIWSLLFAALWLSLAVGRRNGQPLLRSMLLLITACGTAITLAASGSITFFELMGIVAATLFGVIVVGWATGRLDSGPSNAAGPLAVALLGLILLGHSYELTTTNAALLTVALAASAGWLPFLPLPPGEGRGDAGSLWRCLAIALRIALTIIPLAWAATSAITTAIETANPYG